MFVVKEHLAYSEDCFDRPARPGNKDLCMAVDFDSLPAQFGKGMIRIVMDGMSQGRGKEAVELAAPSLYLNLAGELMLLSREMSREVEDIGESETEGAEAFIRDYLQRRMEEVMLNSLRVTNGILRRSTEENAYCTVSVAVVFHRYLFTANLGDSPIFLLDLSDEKSLLAPMYHMDNEAGYRMDRGELTEEEALHSEYQNALLRFLGYESRDMLEDGNINFRMTPLPESFLLLLGSDGALSQLSRQQMTELLRNNLEAGVSLRQILKEFKREVGATGSDDDFTLLMDLVATD